MSWPRWHLYLILPLRAVPKLLPPATHIAAQFSVNSSADQPVASAGSPSPTWVLHPRCWAAHSETAKLWYLMVQPANTLHGQDTDAEKRYQSSSALCKIKTVKHAPFSSLATHKSSNVASRDMVHQDTAYAQGGLRDWQSAECQFSGLTLKQRHNMLCSLCVALKVVFNLLQQTFYSSF